MTGGLVVDTHAVLWYLADDANLSARAASALDAATIGGHRIYVPTICLVEATYLAEKNRITAEGLTRLIAAIEEPSPRFTLAPLDWLVATAVREIARADVPDLPDRIIAATALALGLPLVSRDRKIRAADITTLW